MKIGAFCIMSWIYTETSDPIYHLSQYNILEDLHVQLRAL